GAELDGSGDASSPKCRPPPGWTPTPATAVHGRSRRTANPTGSIPSRPPGRSVLDGRHAARRREDGDMTRVYRHYTQAELDAQFTLDTVPDLEALLARRLAASARVRATLPHRLTVPYGPGANETLDVFPALQGGLAPIQLFIHGGFWRSLDAGTFSVVAAGFSPFGATTAVLDYPLIPAVRLGDIVEGCRSAVAWVHRRAAELGGDGERLYVSGNSAGGHLVALLMGRDWPATFGLPADVIKGGTAISGLYDLTPVALSA